MNGFYLWRRECFPGDKEYKKEKQRVNQSKNRTRKIFKKRKKERKKKEKQTRKSLVRDMAEHGLPISTCPYKVT